MILDVYFSILYSRLIDPFVVSEMKQRQIYFNEFVKSLKICMTANNRCCLSYKTSRY